MKQLCVLLLSLFLLSSCNEKISYDVSYCVLEKIETYKAKGDSTEVIGIYQYYFDNQVCYLLNAACCDMFNKLIDADCNTICLPSGGIAGTGDGKCPTFNKDAVLIKTIWEKD
mgnify:FL=1|jgi:hypothetical protein